MQNDVEELLKRAVKAASEAELKRYVDWTKEFGEDGVQQGLFQTHDKPFSSNPAALCTSLIVP